MAPPGIHRSLPAPAWPNLSLGVLLDTRKHAVCVQRRRTASGHSAEGVRLCYSIITVGIYGLSALVRWGEWAYVLLVLSDACGGAELVSLPSYCYLLLNGASWLAGQYVDTTMAACQIPGHAGSYGLGIRTAFYLQWFGMIITCWFLESDVLNLKFLNGLTILATTIGLALHLGVLQAAEIYVVLLLACGTLYFLVPVYIWRVITCCHARMDTERWNRIRMGWLFRTGTALMFGTLLGMQIWFWCTGVYARPPGTDRSCQQYGFFFGQMLLDSTALTGINIVIHIAMIVMGTWLFCDGIGMFDGYRWRRRRKRRGWRITQDRIVSLQQLRTISDVIVAAILVMAIELVISWNNISSVNNVDSAAQLIPLVISAAYFLRSIYVSMSGPEPDDNSRNDFPFFDGGSGGSYMYTFSKGGGNQHRQPTDDWAGRKRHSHHHHRRRRTARMEHDAGEPVMSTAYSRRATVVDAPTEGFAAGHVPVEPQPVHENA